MREPTEAELKYVKNARRAVQKIVMKEYGQVIVRVRGLGSRMTVDDDDKLQNAAMPAAARVKSAITSLLKVMDLIDPEKLTEGVHKEWFLKLNQARTDGTLDALVIEETTKS